MAWYWRRILCLLFYWAIMSCSLLVIVIVVSSFDEPKGWCWTARVCFQMAVNVLAGWFHSQWGDHYNAADERLARYLKRRGIATELLLPSDPPGTTGDGLALTKYNLSQIQVEGIPAAFRQVNVVLHGVLSISMNGKRCFLFKQCNYVNLCCHRIHVFCFAFRLCQGRKKWVCSDRDHRNRRGPFSKGTLLHTSD